MKYLEQRHSMQDSSLVPNVLYPLCIMGGDGGDLRGYEHLTNYIGSSSDTQEARESGVCEY